MSQCLSKFFFVCPRNYLNNVQDIIKVHFRQLRLVVSFNLISFTHNWLKGVKSSLRFISNLFFSYWVSYWAKNRFASFLTFFCLIGEYQVPRIPRTHMKSLHFWFLVVTYFHICLIGRKIAFLIKFKE